MNINSIRIIEHNSLEEFGLLKRNDEIVEVFKFYGKIQL